MSSQPAAFEQELRWNDYPQIAECLNYLYPETDLVNITETEVKHMVLQLPNFIEKQKKAPENIIHAIITVWIQFSDEEGDLDSRWDAYV
jgi:FeS assembly protein IscX